MWLFVSFYVHKTQLHKQLETARREYETRGFGDVCAPEELEGVGDMEIKASSKRAEESLEL